MSVIVQVAIGLWCSECQALAVKSWHHYVLVLFTWNVGQLFHLTCYERAYQSITLIHHLITNSKTGTQYWQQSRIANVGTIRLNLPKAIEAYERYKFDSTIVMCIVTDYAFTVFFYTWLHREISNLRFGGFHGKHPQICAESASKVEQCATINQYNHIGFDIYILYNCLVSVLCWDNFDRVRVQYC